MESIFLAIILPGLLVGAIYSLVASGLVLIYKTTSVISLTQGGLLLMGAILAYALFSLGLPVWIVILLTLIGIALLGYLLDRFILQPVMGQPLLSSIMITIALAWLFHSVGLIVLAGREVPLLLFDQKSLLTIAGQPVASIKVWAAIISVIFFVIFFLFYKYTFVGLVMRSTAEDHEVTQSLGINVRSIFRQIWLISGLVAASGGILLGSILSVNVGLADMGWKVLAVILLGGLESIGGCIIAGPVIGVLERVCFYYLNPLIGGDLGDIVSYLVMIVILAVKPYGFMGLIRIERI